MAMIDYSENYLIEQPAIELFRSLDYTHLDCFLESFAPIGTLVRETYSNVALVPRQRESLKMFNPFFPAEAIEELICDRGILNPVNANREIYSYARWNNSLSKELRNE